ncbi:carbohydrate-binding protein, partial [Actinoplanes sp. NPDC051633]|uniref:carbohydrate-binding protein n=1 Tax=Actinoplanes sp. NPDC051633 TaxID=3155670 RepID=UPI0034467F49
MALLTAVVMAAAVPAGYALAGPAEAAVACTAPAWAEGNTYQAGAQTTYQSHQYQALVTHTAWPGAGWNPAATPTLWRDLGACTGGGTPPTTPPPTNPP